MTSPSVLASQAQLKTAFDNLENSVKRAQTYRKADGLDANDVLGVLGDFRVDARIRSVDDLPPLLRNLYYEAQRMCRESRSGKGSPVNKIVLNRFVNLIERSRAQAIVRS